MFTHIRVSTTQTEIYNISRPEVVLLPNQCAWPRDSRDSDFTPFIPINGITQGTLVCVGLLSLSMTTARFIPIMYCLF